MLVKILSSTTRNFAVAAVTVFLSTTSAKAVTVDLDSFQSDSIHISGPAGNADYYGGGNDGSNFVEYGITAFNFDAETNFGGPLEDLLSMTLNLTYNDRNFTTDGPIEFFFTTLPVTDWSSLTYDSGSTGGLNFASFGAHTPISLGAFSFSAISDGIAGGAPISYTLNLTAAESAILASINSNVAFSIILIATDPSVEATFSGVGNTFDPGDPNLRIEATVVPEPASYMLLILGGITIWFLRRRFSVRSASTTARPQ